MAEPPTQHAEPLRLYDAFDDAGRAWLDEFVRVFNEGGYAEAARVLAAQEAEAPGAVDE